MIMSNEQEPVAPDPAMAVLADHCHLRIPSQPDWIGPTVEYLVQRARRCGAIPPHRETKLVIALHEALTNAVIHGNLGISSELKERGGDEYFRAVADRLADPAHAMRVVDVRSSYDGHAARWVLHDQGSGFDAEAALSKVDGAQPDFLSPSGRGLLLIKAFTDEMRYEDGGRRLVLAIYRESEEERRNQPRWPLAGTVGVTPIDEQGRPRSQERGAVGRNLSPGGLAFVAEGDPPAGRILLTIPGETGPVEVLAEVRHWQPLEGNVVEVGCRFETPLTWPQTEPIPDTELGKLARLVQRLSGGLDRQEERRAAPRVPYGGRIEAVLPNGETLRGFGRDLSRGGIAFLCSGPLPLEVVQLRLSAGDGEPIVVRALVLRSTKLIDGFYDVAARFVPG